MLLAGSVDGVGPDLETRRAAGGRAPEQEATTMTARRATTVADAILDLAVQLAALHLVTGTLVGGLFWLP
jgi:hypothetical protein